MVKPLDLELHKPMTIHIPFEPKPGTHSGFVIARMVNPFDSLAGWDVLQTEIFARWEDTPQGKPLTDLSGGGRAVHMLPVTSSTRILNSRLLS